MKDGVHALHFSYGYGVAVMFHFHCSPKVKPIDLQSVMALVRGGDLGQPFQFKNFRD